MRRPRRGDATGGAVALLIVVLIAGGVVVTKFLTSAIDFYCNVDEVGHKSGCEDRPPVAHPGDCRRRIRRRSRARSPTS